MTDLQQKILDLIRAKPGLTDRDITDVVLGRSEPQQPVNGAARMLERGGHLRRTKRLDGLIGNYPADLPVAPPVAVDKTPQKGPWPLPTEPEGQSEDQIKRVLEAWLHASGWQTHIAWAKEHGTDIRAVRGRERWDIEVKGSGSRPEMRVNYFLGILGETLQRMDDVEAKYSIALPDLQQFRRLWERLPSLAKRRTGMTALFVAENGAVNEVAFQNLGRPIHFHIRK